MVSWVVVVNTECLGTCLLVKTFNIVFLLIDVRVSKVLKAQEFLECTVITSSIICSLLNLLIGIGIAHLFMVREWSVVQ